ncbi:J domain-containing protein [Prochlorococcus sp. MIT 1300]|uniref:J domain-containing protein n=1 Tax=Prochlorococcus sp. MIT 1300 TaxID=3096218 RepID=UPI002A75910C|nr:J domain-containing protein [Prochlorococcus sp. MIT 1300]
MTSSLGTFTYWSLLGLNPSSNDEEIKKAFRREAMRWHPDVNGNDRNAEERLKWINKAYEVLNDPQKRFEWETAGRPTFEIHKVNPYPPSPIRERAPVRKSPNDDETFSPAEKLLLLLISIFSLFLLNALRF